MATSLTDFLRGARDTAVTSIPGVGPILGATREFMGDPVQPVPGGFGQSVGRDLRDIGSGIVNTVNAFIPGTGANRALIDDPIGFFTSPSGASGRIRPLVGGGSEAQPSGSSLPEGGSGFRGSALGPNDPSNLSGSGAGVPLRRDRGGGGTPQEQAAQSIPRLEEILGNLRGATEGMFQTPEFEPPPEARQFLTESLDETRGFFERAFNDLAEREAREQEAVGRLPGQLRGGGERTQNILQEQVGSVSDVPVAMPGELAGDLQAQEQAALERTALPFQQAVTAGTEAAVQQVPTIRLGAEQAAAARQAQLDAARAEQIRQLRQRQAQLESQFGLAGQQAAADAALARDQALLQGGLGERQDIRRGQQELEQIRERGRVAREAEEPDPSQFGETDVSAARGAAITPGKRDEIRSSPTFGAMLQSVENALPEGTTLDQATPEQIAQAAQGVALRVGSRFPMTTSVMLFSLLGGQQ